jgi:hypothetical protein
LLAVHVVDVVMFELTVICAEAAEARPAASAMPCRKVLRFMLRKEGFRRKEGGSRDVRPSRPQPG